MADEPAPPPPAAPVTPALWPVVLQFFLWFLQSTWLRVVLTILLTLVLIAATVRATLWMVIPDFHAPELPRILPKIRKAEEAIRPIQFGNAGCTGTIMGPIAASDATIDILTAAHCVKLGAVGKMTMHDGRVISVKCIARDPNSDAAWLVADNPGYDVPFLLLADAMPNPGEAVWHQGFGRDKPGNRESGIFNGPAAKGLKAAFKLSVSPGDSGGGIVLDTAGKVVSPVCCTDNMAAMGNVFGASPIEAAKIRPRRFTSEEEPPLFYPILEMPEKVAEWHPPLKPPKNGWSGGDK